VRVASTTREANYKTDETANAQRDRRADDEHLWTAGITTKPGESIRKGRRIYEPGDNAADHAADYAGYDSCARGSVPGDWQDDGNHVGSTENPDEHEQPLEIYADREKNESDWVEKERYDRNDDVLEIRQTDTIN